MYPFFYWAWQRDLQLGNPTGEWGAQQEPSMVVFVWLGRMTCCPRLTGEIPENCRRFRHLSFGDKSFGKLHNKPLPVLELVARSSSKYSLSCARKRSCLNTSRGFVGGDDDQVASSASCRSARAPKNQDGKTIAMSMVTSVSEMQTELRKLAATLSWHDNLVQEVRDAIKLLRKDNSAVSLNPVPFGHCATCKCCKGEAIATVCSPTATSNNRTINSQLLTPGQGKGLASRPTIDTKFTIDHMLFSSPRKKKPARKNLRSHTKSPASPSPEVVDLTSEHVVQSNYYPAENEDVLDSCQGWGRKSNTFPGCDSQSPQNNMNLSPVELAVAVYVFFRDLPHSELLVDVGDCIASRVALMTLVPRAEVVDDVCACSEPHILNVVIRMLTRTSKHTQWFLPTSIMQAALKGRTLTSGTATSLRNNYMRCKVDKVTRCDGHWYLMIIDVPRMKLIYLDSLRDPTQAEARKISMTRVALYLKGLTLGQSWLSGNCSVRPRFSTFDFEEHEVPQQDQKLMDCGVSLSLTSYICRVRFSCVIKRQQRNAYALGGRSGDEVAQRHGQGHRCQSRCSLAGGIHIATAFEKVPVLYCVRTLFWCISNKRVAILEQHGAPR
ncbi:Ulp1 protease family, carboxy-terminal domain protein [Arachis hypogaea]|nr:Ulp1 protease family, carboxy-terminal domain protein [Arachis hypogaea]